MIFDHSLDTISPDDQALLTLGGDVSITGTLAVTSTVTGISFNSITALSSTTPVVDGVGAVGVSTTVARSDHVHPARSTIVVDQGTAAAPSISFTGATDTGLYGSTTAVNITAQGKRVASFYHEDVLNATDNPYFAFENGDDDSLTAVRVIADGVGRPIGVYAHGDSFVALGSNDGGVAFTAYRGPGSPQYISAYSYVGGTDLEVVAPGFNAGLNIITAGSGTSSGFQVFAFDGAAYRRQFSVRPLATMTGTQNSVLVSSANPAGSPVIGVEGGDTNINLDLTVKGTGSIRFNGTTTTIASTGKLTTTASSTTVAGFTLPHGAAPSAPVNGDLWTTTADMFYRLNGTTHTVARLASPTFTGTVGAAAITATGVVQGTRFTSTIATGTAPLTVTSTTRVANLNVATAGTADTWTTARTLTIGTTGKSVNGSADVAWSLAEIGAAASGATVNLTGDQTVAGLKTFSSAVTGLAFNGSAADTVTTPSFTWTGDTTTGMYRSAASTIGFTTAGVARLTVNTTSITGTVPILLAAGAQGTPAYTFSGDPDTGIYSAGTNILAVTTGGTQAATFDASGNTNIIGSIGVKSSAPSTSAAISSSITLGANATRYGILSTLSLDNTETLAADRSAYGAVVNATTSAFVNTAAFTANIYGIQTTASSTGAAGNSLNGEGSLFGIQANATNSSYNQTAFRIENAYGVYGSAQASSTALTLSVTTTTGLTTATTTDTSQIVVGAVISNNVSIPAATTVVSITNATTFEMSAAATGTGTDTTTSFTQSTALIDQAYGIYSLVRPAYAGASITTGYLFYGTNSTVLGTFTNRYGLYVAPAINNYVAGAMQIGGTALGGTSAAGLGVNAQPEGAGTIVASSTIEGTRFISTQAIGTAPLTVTSTTRVANLNVATAGTADTWTTARTLTIGATGKSVSGAANVAWTTAEIGAVGQTSATGSAILPTGTTAQRDGSPTNGYTRFNTTLQALETYTTTGAQWLVAGSQTGTVLDQTFNGTGAQTAFTLSAAPGSLGLVEVFISGVRQSPTTHYSVTGTTLTFVTAPPSGTNNIFVRWTTTIASTVGSLTGDLTLTGSSLRIKGDFSNATAATRTAIQTTTTNGATIVNALPAGTSTTSEFRAYNNAVPTNGSYLGLEALSTETRLESGRDGSGSYLPLAVHVSGAESFHINTTGELSGLKADGLNGGQLAGMRNKIMNGKMEISQRGTTFSFTTGYTLDRWYAASNMTLGVNVTQAADGPATGDFVNCLRHAIVALASSPTATQSCTVQQLIEGYNTRDLIGKTFTVSFWVKSSLTGVHCVAFQNFGVDRSYVTTYTVNAANTWEFKTVTVTGGLITAGTWNSNTGIGLRVIFTLAAGTNFQTTANAWQVGNFLSTSAQVVHTAAANAFNITGVQLEVGTVATPFEHRPFGIEQMLCQRYYNNLTKSQLPILVAAATTGLFLSLQHPVSMRVAPTLSTNIADANFSTSGAPPANTWGLQVIGISVATKSGTVTVTVTADVDKSAMYIYGGTFTGAYNVLSPGTGIFITTNAEL